MGVSLNWDFDHLPRVLGNFENNIRLCSGHLGGECQEISWACVLNIRIYIIYISIGMMSVAELKLPAVTCDGFLFRYVLCLFCLLYFIGFELVLHSRFS